MNRAKLRRLRALRSIPPRPRSGLEALLALADEIASVRIDQPLPLDVDIPDTVDRVAAVTARIQALVPAMDSLPRFDIEPVCKLRWYAAAAQHAHDTAGQTDRDAAVLTRVSIKLRDDLLSSAVVLARFGWIDPRRLAVIQNATHIDLARDLSELASLYEDYWDRIAGRTLIDPSMPVRARVIAMRLSKERAGSRGCMTVESARTRRQAFMLLVRAYAHSRRGVSLVRWDHGDADVIAPPLGIPRRVGGQLELVREAPALSG